MLFCTAELIDSFRRKPQTFSSKYQADWTFDHLNGHRDSDLVGPNTQKIKLLEAWMLFKTRPRDKR